MHQIRRDYTFWCVVLAQGKLDQWVSQLFGGDRANFDASTTLDAAELIPTQGGKKVGCGLTVSISASELDALWRSTEDQRPSAPSGSPFSAAEKEHGPTLFKTAVQIAELLFGVRDFVDDKGGHLIGATAKDVSSDVRCAFLCFTYNILNGITSTRFIEPSHKGDDFWIQVDEECAPHQATLGLAWIMSASRNRATQIHEALDRLATQITRESWTSSLFSWFASDGAREGTDGLAPGVGGMNPWMMLARAILLGSPLVTEYVCIERAIARAISPYEDPLEFMESSCVGTQVKHISTLAGTHTLARSLRPLNTPLSRGCMPPTAIYNLSWDLGTNEVEVKHVDLHELRDQVVDGCYMAFDIRGALGGCHTEIPRDRFPECCILAMLSLAVDTPFMQNYVACTTEWAAVLQTIWPHLQGKFARREVEMTYRLLGAWCMRDQMPAAREIGSLEWLFNNSGLAISPRAKTTAAALTAKQLPNAFIVDGVRLELDRTNKTTINYRRV